MGWIWALGARYSDHNWVTLTTCRQLLSVQSKSSSRSGRLLFPSENVFFRRLLKLVSRYMIKSFWLALPTNFCKYLLILQSLFEDSVMKFGWYCVSFFFLRELVWAATANQLVFVSSAFLKFVICVLAHKKRIVKMTESMWPNEFFLIIRLPPEFLPVSGPLTWWFASTLGTALLCSSRAGSWFRAYCQVARWITLRKIKCIYQRRDP